MFVIMPKKQPPKQLEGKLQDPFDNCNAGFFVS